jgi:hypothetical protein
MARRVLAKYDRASVFGFALHPVVKNHKRASVAVYHRPWPLQSLSGLIPVVYGVQTEELNGQPKASSLIPGCPVLSA